jgi:hypothetical protein
VRCANLLTCNADRVHRRDFLLFGGDFAFQMVCCPVDWALLRTRRAGNDRRSMSEVPHAVRSARFP